MNVLLSIHPEHAEKIYKGIKIIEWRKVTPKLTGGEKIYLYETSPVMKVTGFFTVGKYSYVLDNEELEKPNSKIIEFGQVSKEFLKRYKGESPALYGLIITSYTKFDTSKALADFGVKRAPQNYQYTDKDF